ncbi:hypothetical protein BDF21DRAFT_491340 [Thamnidium elegans]|nr:hypothetical protein BDF21DRAFT_491340 [Thamnidium elegans]
MEGRPKRSTILEKDYRERKRARRRSSEKSVTSPIIQHTEEPVSYTILERLYKDILQFKDPEDDEYELSTLFLELPSKKMYPDYYQVIKNPIALEDMKAKIDAKQYSTMSQFKADIDLMVANAKKYNVKDSQVYGDAIKIQKFVKAWTPPKEKAIVKLPAGAFSHSPLTKIKAIKLRAVDKHKPKSNINELMESINKKETKRSLELLEQDENLDPNELVPVEMFSDTFTWSPLHAASYYGDVKLAEALISRGANVELNDTWYSATPLGWAAFGDKDKVVKLLVQKYNANVKAKNIHGQVPFDVVSNQADPRWIGLLKPPTPKAQKQSLPQPAPQSQPQPQQQLPSQPLQPQIQQQTQLAQHQAILQKQLQQQRQAVMNPPQTHVSTIDGQSIRKRRGRPPKSETDAAAVRPTKEIDISTFDPVAFEIELFNAIRTHTDNLGRLYSELFEDLPDRSEYPEYYKTIKNPRSLSEIAEKMQTRSYPNLHSWMNDMKLVFENALSFNEPGSRIFRDAKLLMRLLHRLKERILARLCVPISQEDAVFRLSLSNRPFDVDSLSEDKRKIKRFLTNNKSRTQSMEPENSQMPIMNPYILQQAQQLQQQQQQQQQQHQQQMLLQQQILLQQQQQQQQLQRQQLKQQQQQPLIHQQVPPLTTAMPQPHMLMQSPLYDINAFNGRVLPNNLSPVPESSAQSQNSPLNKASDEFYALFSKGGFFLSGLKLSSNNNQQFDMSIPGKCLGHSIIVPAQVEGLVIQPEFPKELKEEENRLSIVVLQNNVRLNTVKDTWTTVPLVKGMNSIKINITANITQPDATLPEYKSQSYHLFITQTW